MLFCNFLPPHHDRPAVVLQFLRPDIWPEALSPPACQSAQRRDLQPMRIARTVHTPSSPALLVGSADCAAVSLARHHLASPFRGLSVGFRARPSHGPTNLVSVH